MVSDKQASRKQLFLGALTQQGKRNRGRGCKRLALQCGGERPWGLKHALSCFLEIFNQEGTEHVPVYGGEAEGWGGFE